MNFNERLNGGKWNTHGTYTFGAGAQATLQVSDQNGQAAADAVRFVLAAGDTTPPANVSNFTATNPATGGRLNLSWTNPGSDFAGVLILRRAGSPVTKRRQPARTTPAGKPSAAAQSSMSTAERALPIAI